MLQTALPAFTLAVTGEYDAIILDLMLPGMDGIDLLGKLRQEARKSDPDSNPYRKGYSTGQVNRSGRRCG